MAAVGLLSVAGAAHAVDVAVAETANLEGVVVTGRNGAPTLYEVPGGVSVVTTEVIQSGRVSNLSDALRNVPGVFAQSVSGGEGTRLSIRGSGISKGGFTWGNGTQVLFDGFPITTAFGTPYESFEPNALHHIEVYKGANGFEYGATQLGGVINFVQNTGRDSSPLFLRLEGGSFGYQRQQISSGKVFGPLDYYLSLTHFKTDGYRQNSAAESTRFIGNVGYQVTPQLLTRLYFSWSQQDQENISALTLAQLLKDPEQNPFTGRRVARASTFLASKTTYDIDDRSSLELGLGYKRPHLHNGNLPQRTFWHTSDWAASLKYRRQDTVFGGRQSNTTVALLASAALPGSGAKVTDERTGATVGRITYDGSNTTLLVSNDLQVTPKLWLLTGIGWVKQTRENEILNRVAAGVNPKLDVDYSNYTPRLGLRYEITPTVQVYGNVSRLLEAPQIIGYSTSANGVYTGFGRNGRLDVQSGTSYEVGFKGSSGRLTWDIDYYYERIKNELLTVYTTLPSPAVPNGVTETTNALPTIHQGIEASLSAVLWSRDGSDLTLRQAYTWNDFHFVDENLAAGRGDLPGLPSQVYQAGLRFDHRSGFYASADIDAVLTDYPVDYVNRNFAPSYTLVGLTVGYQHPGQDWRVFLQGQNLTDEVYASFTSATFNGTGAAAYTPGVGRSVTAGVSYAF